MTVPTSVAGVRWRVGAPDDLDVITAVRQSADRVDQPEYTFARSDVEVWLATVDPAQAVVIGERGGEPVAAGVVYRPDGGPVRVRGAVVPAARRQGIGRVLLRHQLERAVELHPDAPALGLRSTGVGGVTALARRAGFEPVRFFLTMRRDLGRPIRSVSLPGDLRVVPFTSDLDEPLRVVRNAVFRDHWMGQEEGPEEWRARTLGPLLIRELSTIAVESDGRIAGFVVVWRTEGYSEQVYIDLVGTVRQHRGRGVASALIASTLLAAATAGFTRAELDVDGSNPTGAGRVYTGAGFEEVGRATMWELPLPAAGTPLG